MFLCPVCFFDQMPDPPQNYNICPCCGTEFEFDDEVKTHAQLRQEWIAGGAKWFFRQPPPFWSAAAQLAQANRCWEPVQYVTIGKSLPVYGAAPVIYGVSTVTSRFFVDTLSEPIYYCQDLAELLQISAEADESPRHNYVSLRKSEKCELALAG